VSLGEASVAAGEAIVDVDVAALRPSEGLKSMPKGVDASLCFRIILHESVQEADAPHALGLLCTRRERQCGCRRDELAASDESCHVIPPAGRATEG
jgi:hypothetical protein